jgi:ATP adenylyltransferase
MERFFTPWRLEYLTSPREPGCIFCIKPQEAGRERDNLILHRGERSFVILNRYPYSSGHLMVVPLRHTSEFESLTREENHEMARLLQAALAILRRTYKAEGFNIGMNLERAGGAGIREHLHWHIVPRWIGDTNFMPLLADVRIVPQLLLDAWDVLRPQFAALDASSSPGAGAPEAVEA